LFANHWSAARVAKYAVRETLCFIARNSIDFDFAAAMTITAAIPFSEGAVPDGKP
jgi:hypothetical protein